MAVTLSSQEVAALTGKTERTVRRWAESGKFPAERTLNKFNSPEYFFSLNDLTPDLQEKYYNQLRASLPEASFPEEAKPKAAKPLDTYSIDEQEEIAFWLRLVKQWQGYRNKPGPTRPRWTQTSYSGASWNIQSGPFPWIPYTAAGTQCGPTTWTA